MGLKLLVGKFLNWAINGALARSSFPLLPRTGLGISWPYDIARFSGSRDLLCFFDVGANTGQTCDQIVRFYPRAEVHAFEPVSATCAELRRRMAGRAKIQVHQMALGKQPGELRIRLQRDDQLNSLRYASKPGLVDTGETESVIVSTVDEFARARRIATIDLLKVDAQGTEVEVHEGAEAMLRAHRIRFVLCEVGLQPDDDVNQPFQPLHEHLCARGLRLCGFYDGGNIGPRWRYACHRDALYVDPRFPDFMPTVSKSG